MSPVLRYILTALIAYLLGSLSTGLVLAKIRNKPDLREVGSKNTGATNALRVMGLRDGILVFLGDVAKALLSCWIGQLITGRLEGAMLAGIMVVIGHNWPIFFQFRGGKGAACTVAVMLYCFPVPALLSYIVGIALIAIWRYVSVGSMAVIIAYALIITFLAAPGNAIAIAWAWLLAAFLVARHHANIDRLIHGTERKLGQKEKT